MTGRSILPLLLLTLALGAPPRQAGAAVLVVVEVRGTDLQPGQTIEAGAKLTLKEGQQVTLLSESGQTVRLRGPSDGPLAVNEGLQGPDTAAALEALVTQKLGRVEKAGVVRAGPAQAVPPEPWLIDVSRSGIRCLPVTPPDAGEAQVAPIMLWRPTAATEETLLAAPWDQSWQVRTGLPAGEDRVVLPRAVPVTGRATYSVTLGGKTSTITLLGIPTTVANDTMRAAWMSEKGCDGQALALLKRVGKAGEKKTGERKHHD